MPQTYSPDSDDTIINKDSEVTNNFSEIFETETHQTTINDKIYNNTTGISTKFYFDMKNKIDNMDDVYIPENSETMNKNYKDIFIRKQ